MDMKDFAYAILLDNYLKVMGRGDTVESTQSIYESNKDLIPYGFETSFSMDTKMKIISEGIEKKIPLGKTDCYTHNQEDVRHPKGARYEMQNMELESTVIPFPNGYKGASSP